MSDQSPFPFVWDGEVMRPPSPFWAKRADERFVIGLKYTLQEHQERSWKTHAHYFACLNEAWQNLPEKYGNRYPTAESLRKRALIETGYRNERSIVAESEQQAERIASFIQDMDEFAVVVVSGCVVTSYTAKSQSMKAMGKDEFQRSKNDVLGFVANLVGVNTDELSANAGAAA